VIALVTFIELAYRIHVEEHALLEELGERYRTYGEQHKRLVPFVW
jgi:protein-S-isoprenylcysteine O-methyltransferase Ste14